MDEHDVASEAKWMASEAKVCASANEGACAY